MSYGLGKKDNEYSRSIADVDAPKTVWMAIALSLAARVAGIDEIGDDRVRETVLAEWAALHANGIVPQPVVVAGRRHKP